MYFVNSVAYNGLQGAQSREGHLNLAAARWELGNSNDVVITNPFLCADPWAQIGASWNEFHARTRNTIHTDIQHDMTFLNPPADPKYCPQPAIPKQTHPVTLGRRTVPDTPSRCPAKSACDEHAPQQALPRLSSVPPFPSLPHYAASQGTLTVGERTLILSVNMQNGSNE